MLTIGQWYISKQIKRYIAKIVEDELFSVYKKSILSGYPSVKDNNQLQSAWLATCAGSGICCSVSYVSV